ncbi:MAG: hypothetical protein LBE91_20995 [Tannerella sp.]|jgi:hypothetical protein|nr:hypothetical protein [Tannerella sp.]
MKSKWMLITCSLLLTGWMYGCNNSKASNTNGSDNAATVDNTTTGITQVSESTDTEAVKTVKEETNAPINIPAANGVMTEKLNEEYGTYDKLKRITAAERKELGIDALPVVNEAVIKEHPNTELAKGKEIYKDAKGRLATFLVIVEEHAVFEYLVSYNTAGAVIDCIRIGLRMAYSDDNGFGTIEGNQVKYHWSWVDAGEEGAGTDIYTITDDLHFVLNK